VLSAKAVLDTQILIGDGTGFTAAALSGDVTMSNGGVVTIADDAITTAKISDANVTLAKIENIGGNTVIVRDASDSGVLSAKAVLDTQILIGDGTGFTATALSGDVTMNNEGAVTLAAAQTNIQSIINSSLTKIGTAADQEYITFGTANEVNIFVNNNEKISVHNNGVNLTGGLNVVGEGHKFQSSTSNSPLVQIKNTTNDTKPSVLEFVKDKGGAGASADSIGEIQFTGDDAAQNLTTFALMKSEVGNPTNGQEGGKLTFQVANYDSTLQTGLTIDGSNYVTQAFNVSKSSTTVDTGDTTNVRVGMVVTGDGIDTNTTVASITNSTTFELSQNATGNHTGTTLSFFNNTGDVNVTIASGTGSITNVTGKLGIGTDNPDSKLQINAGSSSGNNLLITSTGGAGAECSMGITSDISVSGYGFIINGKDLQNTTPGNRKLIIQSSKSGDGTYDNGNTGNDGFGSLLTCTSDGYVFVCTETSANPSYRFQINGSGLASGGTFDNSDDRIKFNEESINSVSALSIINQLQPQKYEKITELPQDISGTWMPADTEWSTVKDNYVWNLEAGLIAQDVRDIPELAFAVNGEEVNSEGTQIPLSINYNDIYAYHIAATKELSSQLDTEKAKTTTLETQMTAANTQINTLETQVADLIARIAALENP
jgi:hypothetical protein